MPWPAPRSPAQNLGESRGGCSSRPPPAPANRQRGLFGFSVLSELPGFISPVPLLGWFEVSVLGPALLSAGAAFGLAGALARLASLAEEGRERSMLGAPRPIGWPFLPLIIFPLQSHMHSSSDLPRSRLRAAAGLSFSPLSIGMALPVSLLCAVDLLASVLGCAVDLLVSVLGCAVDLLASVPCWAVDLLVSFMLVSRFCARAAGTASARPRIESAKTFIDVPPSKGVRSAS